MERRGAKAFIILLFILAAIVGGYIGWVTAPYTWNGHGYTNTQEQVP